MKRSEKIDLIKSGKYIIENDMRGSEEAEDLLIEIDNMFNWSTNWTFYGKDKYGKFVFLYKSELNDRPRFKMSELVEMEELKEVFTLENYTRLKNNSHGAILTDEYMIKELNQMEFDAYKSK